MDWASDNARLSYQEASLRRIFKYSPRASVAIKIVKSNQYQLQIWSLETEEQWAEWLQSVYDRKQSDNGLIAILAKRSGEVGGNHAAFNPSTYPEWAKSAQREEDYPNGPRRMQTFATLSGEQHPVKVVPDGEQRQPGIRILPFTYDTFRKICDAFDVHGSFTRSFTRTDVPSFSSEKVDMGYAAYVYNCRTSNSWPSDMALSATHNRGSGLTYAVFHGCTTAMEGPILKRLESVGSMATHPLVMSGIFAELELVRHNGLVDANVVGMETEVFQLNFEADGSQSFERAEMNKRNEAKREAWLDATYLRNSLITWNVQIKKMLTHVEELTSEPYALSPHSGLVPHHKNSGDESPSSATTLTPDAAHEVEVLFELASGNGDLKAKERHGCETSYASFAVPRAIAGEKIKARLSTMHEEYEEKIRDCTMRVDGMAMATQWSHSETTVEMALATNRESRVMKSISLVTMIFLPGTFFATVFSMTFFDWSGDGGKGRVSSYLWIYIVVTAFFTAGTIGMWYFVVIYRRTPSKDIIMSKELDVEKESIIETGGGIRNRIIDTRDKVLHYWYPLLKICFRVS